MVGEGFRIVYPSGAEARAARLREWLPKSRRAACVWLGIEARGTPVLHLVPDHDAMPASGRYRSPKWAVGVALQDDRIYFRLDLVDTTPANRLELVLDHEIVHQLLNHLGGARLPRWFEEGLCVAFAGLPFLDVDTSVEHAAAAGRLPTLEETRLLFHGNSVEAAKAYEIGHRAVRFLMDHHGQGAMRRLLAAVARGRSFEDAFVIATGETLEKFEAEWRADVTPWLPFWLYLFVSDIGLTLLWAGALLVFLGWLRRRLRRERDMASLETHDLPRAEDR